MGKSAGLGARQSGFGAYSLKDSVTSASPKTGTLFALEESLKKKEKDAYLVASR